MDKSEKYISFFFFVLTMHIAMEFLSAFFGSVLHLSSTSSISFLIYAIMFVRFVWCYIGGRYVNARDFVWLGLIYLFYLVFYIGSDFKGLYTNTGMILLYLFNIPISICIFSNIKSWESFENIAQKYINCNLVLGILTVLIMILFGSTNTLNNSTYMTTSYALLPIICSAFYLSRKKRQVLPLLLSVANMVLMIIYGARMPLFLAILYFLISSLGLLSRGKKLVFIIFVLFVGVLFGTIENNPFLQNAMNTFATKYNSHIVKQFLQNQLFSSSGRNAISEIMVREIHNMKGAYGLFGDRYFTTSYAHNIIYESILSFGWIGSAVFFSLLVALIVTAFYAGYKTGTMLIYTMIVVCFFCKFFVSSSFAIDWSFFYFIGLSLSFIRMKPYKERT